MAPQYTSRNTQATVAAGVFGTKVLEANANRVSLIISNNGTLIANNLLELRTRASNAAAFLWLPFSEPITIPYRDFGPVIKDAIFIAVSNGNADFNITEVVKVP